MDFYSAESGYMLGHIDLDALHVELQYTKDHTTQSAKRLVKRNILNRHGNFDELRSDHARDFMGQVLSMPSKEAGYIYSSTGGYWVQHHRTGCALCAQFPFLRPHACHT